MSRAQEGRGPGAGCMGLLTPRHTQAGGPTVWILPGLLPKATPSQALRFNFNFSSDCQEQPSPLRRSPETALYSGKCKVLGLAARSLTGTWACPALPNRMGCSSWKTEQPSPDPAGLRAGRSLPWEDPCSHPLQSTGITGAAQASRAVSTAMESAGPVGRFILQTGLSIVSSSILQLGFLKLKQKTRKAGAGIETWTTRAILAGEAGEQPTSPLFSGQPGHIWAS